MPLGILSVVIALCSGFCFEVAVICTSPLDSAVTIPSLSTVAIWSLLEDQFMFLSIAPIPLTVEHSLAVPHFLHLEM
jgi:hypothetical protein